MPCRLQSIVAAAFDKQAMLAVDGAMLVAAWSLAVRHRK